MEHAPGNTVPQLDNIGDLSDADQVLESDQVRAALQGGGLFQSRDYVCSLIGRPQKHGQILVSPIAADPRAGEAVSYHMTVPRSRHDARRLPPTWEVWSSGVIYERGFPATLLPRDRRP